MKEKIILKAILFFFIITNLAPLKAIDSEFQSGSLTDNLVRATEYKQQAAEFKNVVFELEAHNLTLEEHNEKLKKQVDESNKKLLEFEEKVKELCSKSLEAEEKISQLNARVPELDEALPNLKNTNLELMLNAYKNKNFEAFIAYTKTIKKEVVSKWLDGIMKEDSDFLLDESVQTSTTTTNGISDYYPKDNTKGAFKTTFVAYLDSLNAISIADQDPRATIPTSLDIDTFAHTKTSVDLAIAYLMMKWIDQIQPTNIFLHSTCLTAVDVKMDAGSMKPEELKTLATEISNMPPEDQKNVKERRGSIRLVTRTLSKSKLGSNNIQVEAYTANAPVIAQALSEGKFIDKTKESFKKALLKAMNG